MTNILKLHGTEKKLYQLVAPLIMSPEALRYNNNYPFKTGESFTWYIAIQGKKIAGFIPVEKRKSENIINNYYADQAYGNVLEQLLDAIRADYDDKNESLSAIVQVSHLKTFLQKGFEVTKEWKQYIKMRRAL